MHVHPDMRRYLDGPGRGRRLVAATAKRDAFPLPRFVFGPGDSLVFGPETRGLPPHISAICAHRVRIPMRSAARSLNLSTAAGIMLYAALAQLRPETEWSISPQPGRAEG
jgi:tRNA (cytidine/uridine-2'-O-)-methyltransferase